MPIFPATRSTIVELQGLCFWLCLFLRRSRSASSNLRVAPLLSLRERGVGIAARGRGSGFQVLAASSSGSRPKDPDTYLQYCSLATLFIKRFAFSPQSLARLEYLSPLSVSRQSSLLKPKHVSEFLPRFARRARLHPRFSKIHFLRPGNRSSLFWNPLAFFSTRLALPPTEHFITGSERHSSSIHRAWTTSSPTQFRSSSRHIQCIRSAAISTSSPRLPARHLRTLSFHAYNSAAHQPFE